MIRIREIDHVVLRVRELDEMINFYCDVLGCHVEKIQPAIGLIQLRAGSCLVDLIDVDGKLGRLGGQAPDINGKNVDHVCFRIDPFDADVITKYLHSHAIIAGPIESRYGAEGFGPSIYIEDPEGNTIELKGPPDLSGVESTS